MWQNGQAYSRQRVTRVSALSIISMKMFLLKRVLAQWARYTPPSPQARHRLYIESHVCLSGRREGLTRPVALRQHGSQAPT
jgi:hypothetical protein